MAPHTRWPRFKPDTSAAMVIAGVSPPRSVPAYPPGVYGEIAGATLMGVALDGSPIDPIKALFRSVVINAVMAAAIVLPEINEKVMGAFTASRSLMVMDCNGADAVPGIE
jgi:hypothetical protein